MQERHLLRTMIDNLPHYIFVKNRENRFIVSNLANARYLGASHPSRVIGKQNSDFLPPQLASLYDAADERIMAGGESIYNWEEEVYNPATDEVKWYAITKVPLLGGDDQITGLVGMIRDVTEAKLLEQEMQRANDQLAELSRLKSHFLLKMSHELRTPLNSVIGYTDMLLSGFGGELNETQRDRLRRVHENGEALLALINDMLDLSRIQTDSVEVKLEVLDVAALAQQVVQDYQAMAKQRGLALGAQLSPALAPALASRENVTKVLGHLVENGLKFTQQGGVTLHLRPLESPAQLPPDFTDGQAAQPWLHVVVEDTGIGIEPDAVQRLFNEFSQLDDSPTRQYGGTGLGLAIAFKLVKLMKGHLWVESTPGVGSRFQFVLPAAD
ncbi:MAG: PAS domain-containing protein [Anaerolineae bacterium]|nr:PAS domain-containing protein [Anaerolineae bacterium]